MKPGGAGTRTPARRAGTVKPSQASARHTSAHERQAQDRGARFGASTVADAGLMLGQGLLSAPVAGLNGAASVGQALPIALRQQLETAFAADLSAVRLHTDVPAQLLARQHGALALAAGAHIYFAPDRFSPHSAAGRDLLAHEITHVLQQVGRAGHDGLLVANNLPRGGGAPQAALDFERLKSVHGRGDSSTSFAQRASEIKALGSDKVAFAKYAEDHWSELASWPTAAQSLLYDVAKRLEDFELAARLIERDNFKAGIGIRTAFYSKELDNALTHRRDRKSVV